MTRYFRLLAGFVVVCLGVSTATAGPVDIAKWNLTGAPGNQPETAASYAAANVTAADVTRGGAIQPNIAVNSINSNTWNVYQSGLSNGYYTFGFTVASGFRVSLDKLLITTRSSNTGPGTVVLRYSGDGFANSLYTFTQLGESFLDSVIDLSMLTGLVDWVEFRLYSASTVNARGLLNNNPNDVVATGGTFRVTNYGYRPTNNPAGDPFYLTGDVEAIPEPSSLTLMGLLGIGAAGFWIRRRRIRARSDVK